MLDEETIQGLEALGGINGTTSLPMPIITDFLLSPTYCNATVDEIMEMVDKIEAPWKKEIS